MGTIWNINNTLDEVERLYKEGYKLSDAIEIVKGYCSDQTNNNLGYKTNNIVPLKGRASNEENY